MPALAAGEAAATEAIDTDFNVGLRKKPSPSISTENPRNPRSSPMATPAASTSESDRKMLAIQRRTLTDLTMRLSVANNGRWHVGFYIRDYRGRIFKDFDRNYHPASMRRQGEGLSC